MRAFITIIFVPCFLLSTHGQYRSLPDSNAVWVLVQDGGYAGELNYYALLTDTLRNDTVVNGNTYTKLFAYYIDPERYIGCYRSEPAGRTYYLPADSVQEFLLYDFSKKPGDTVNNMLRSLSSSFNIFDLFTDVVDSIDTLVSGTNNLKVLYLKEEGSNNTWIEIIGNTRGIFNRDNMGLGVVGLYCMSKDDTTYYLNGPAYAPGKCPDPDVLNGIRKQVQETSFLIYPNPTTGELRITNDELRMMNSEVRLSAYDLRLYDIYGRVVLENLRRTTNNEQLNLSHLPAGMYFLEISGESGRHTARVVKR